MPKPKQERKYKYYAEFESFARCVVDESHGKNLALASVADLKTLLPIDAEQHSDLLPIAANACVANLANANGDIMDTEVALSVYKKFKNKFINVEHDRSKIVGHITNAALTKFNSNYQLGVGSEILSEEDCINGFEPFNIAIAGYVYRYAARGVSNKLIEANDPDSPIYLSAAVSWEVGFDDFVLMAGSKERGEEVEIIDDPKLIEAYAARLKKDKTKRMTHLEDGRPVYRMIIQAKTEDGEIDPDSVIPLGVGLTFSPAGAVAGVVTSEFEAEASQENEQNDTPSLLNEENQEILTKSISQSSLTDVTTIIQKPMLKSFKSLDDIKNITDETAKEFSFANVQNVIEASIEKQMRDAVEAANVEWTSKLEAEKTEKEAARNEAAANKALITEVSEELKKTKEALATLEAAQNEALAAQKFNERMSFFDENYNLSDAMRQVLAARVKTLSDDDFKAYAEGEFAVFGASFKKEEETEETKNEAVASKTEEVSEEAAKKTAEEALASTEVKTPEIPNAVATTESFMDKYAKAFEGEAISFTAKRKSSK